VQASAHSLVNHVTVPHIDADVVASTEFASPQDAREWMVAESRSDVGGEHHG
jgi:hypothetical protein